MRELERRVAAAQACVDRFTGQPLVYGKTDCVRMAAFVLRHLGKSVGLARGGSYSTAQGAARALRRAGHDDLSAALDHTFPGARIPPASCLPADLLLLPAETFGGAIFVSVGNGRVFGYFDGEFRVGQPLLFEAAWRVVDG